MSLQLQFSMDSTNLLYQQDTNIHVTLANIGQVSLDVMHPKMDNSQPIVHVTNSNTGNEEIFRSLPDSHKFGEEPLLLAPGQQLLYDFNLLGIVTNLDPGTYEVSLAWEFNQGNEVAESESMGLTVLPTTPQNIHLVDAVGGRGTVKNCIWVNLAGDTPRIVRSSLSLQQGGTVSNIMAVAPSKLKAKPVMSAPASGLPLRNHWVAWIEGLVLKYTHVDSDLGVLPTRHISLPNPFLEIVKPLYSEQSGDPAIRPPGEALLYQETAGASQFSLIRLELREENVSNTSVVSFFGPKPSWIMSHVFTPDKRVVTYLQKQGTEVALYLAVWPSEKNNQESPIRISSWEGNLRGIDARLGKDKVIRGGLIIEKTNQDGVWQVFFISWSISETGEVKIGPEQILDWEPANAIAEARIAINDTGVSAALIKDEEGTWHVWSSEGLSMVGPKYQKSKQPVKIAFIDGVGKPCLICASVAHGLEIVNIDGTPIPPRPQK